MGSKKKLIEVALPLEAINKASAREKQPGIGAHPRGLHLWWARRPLAAARAVIFAQMVDDPSAYVDALLADPKVRRKAESVLKERRKRWEAATTLARKAREFGLEAPTSGEEPTLEGIAAELERERLFKIIEDLVQWENATNETLLQAARDEIWKNWRRTCGENAGHPRVAKLFDPHRMPAFHDPFAGGGALPLEAQRLGLESYASDLNPVAVLINKAMIEIPPKFAGRPPVNPEARKDEGLFKKEWKGAQGLAEDVRYYGKWMRDEAEKRIGHLYPKVEITDEMAKERPDLKPLVGKKLTVIAWIWARTVKSPNPAFADVDVPLASTFMLSTKAGKEAYVEPVVEDGGYRFTVKVGKPKNVEAAKSGTKVARGANFGCLMSGTPITSEYIKDEGNGGRMGSRLMAIIAEGNRRRIYLAPSQEHTAVGVHANPGPEQEISYDPASGATFCVLYGIRRFGDLFTNRQLVALATFSDLLEEAREIVWRDATEVWDPYDGDGKGPAAGGAGAVDYSDAVLVYLAFAISRLADYNSSAATWKPSGEQVMHTFTRQAIPMTWDFAESNVLGSSAICWKNAVQYAADNLLATAGRRVDVAGFASQAAASNQTLSLDKIVSTDPPYYDNVPYADLSDFFYVWLRRSLHSIFPDLFSTLTVPKVEELVVQPSRHGSKDEAESFFLDGMGQAMHCLAEQGHPAFPVTIYYAFKQSETKGNDGTASTGWETFLDAVIRAGFAISGTWPMRTEASNRMLGISFNALASSIVLVCRKHDPNAPTATRKQFLNVLKSELPEALTHLQHGNIAPVDLAQAAIGPGMAVYTRYSKVLDAEGKPLSVREALALVNQTLDEVLAEQEGDFDADSRWALAWFEQVGFAEGEYGVAETLSKAKNTSVSGLVQGGILASKAGKVRLLKPSELPTAWDPATDPRLTAWEMVHHLIRALESGGESGAAALVSKLGGRAETARELCYRLYTVCERKKRATEALSYNALVQSWPEITRLAREGAKAKPHEQGELFEEVEV